MLDKPLTDPKTPLYDYDENLPYLVVDLRGEVYYAGTQDDCKRFCEENVISAGFGYVVDSTSFHAKENPASY